jgi:hypothetical protein
MNKLGIGQMEMLDILLKEMNEKFAKNIKNRPHNKVTINSRNCHIVVGHGPDWKIQAIKLKDTKIPIISTDVCCNELLDMGIIPKYVVTLEEAHKNVKADMFDYKRLKENRVKVIGSSITREWLEKDCDKYGVKFSRFTDYSQSMVTNVGQFGVVFAESLFADNVIIMGMNNYGPENYPWLDWYTHWRTYIGQKIDNFIINCTEGGILYFDKIFDIDFDDLEIT